MKKLNKIAKRKVITKFIKKTSRRLKISLPEKIVDGAAIK